MKIVVDGFEFDFQDAISAFVFDEKDRTSPTYHGLSHAMKAVDLIVELEDDYLFVEVKDFHEPEEYQDRNFFNHLRDVLKYKYRDSFLYRWAEQKTDKPIAIKRWQQAIAKNCAVLNVERWNRNFPKWPVSRV
jgi:hypothetical protein